MFEILAFQLPQASEVAKQVDQLFSFLSIGSAISFTAVIGAILFFIIKYHRSKTDPEKTPNIEGNPILEGTVVTGLFLVFMAVFYWGWVLYGNMRTVSPDALEINVLAQKWRWDAQYTNGRNMENGVLVVPKDRNVKLILTSKDVLHSFYIPEMRIKQDAIPNSFSYLSFTPNLTGDFHVTCAEFCGTDHSNMMLILRVLESKDYEAWQKRWEWETRLGVTASSSAKSVSDGSSASGIASPSKTLAEMGKEVFNKKACASCHTVTGAPLVGPGLKGIFGHEVEMANGDKVNVDENYIRESLMVPSAKVVKGFSPVMPTFKGTISDEEVNQLIAYIKSL